MDRGHTALDGIHRGRRLEGLNNSPEGQAESAGSDFDVGRDPATDHALDIGRAWGLDHGHCDHWGTHCTAGSPDCYRPEIVLALAIAFARFGGRADIEAGQQSGLVAIADGVEGRPCLCGGQSEAGSDCWIGCEGSLDRALR